MTRSVPFTMNVPFVGHQRDLAEVDLLLLHVLDRAHVRLRSTSQITSWIVTFSGAAKVMPR